ncbi:MAG TPA: hypothetical protein VMM13_09080 [Euzebya sp.]|nr:hypothetical protein [Euzebya sp.]
MYSAVPVQQSVTGTPTSAAQPVHSTFGPLRASSPPQPKVLDALRRMLMPLQGFTTAMVVVPDIPNRPAEWSLAVLTSNPAFSRATPDS